MSDRKLSKEDLEMKVSKDDLKKMLTETELPALIEQFRTSLNKNLPPKPTIPEDVPQDFQEALFSHGPCAIPLWSGDKWRFALFNSGEQIVDSRTGHGVMFDSYDEAIRQVRGYVEYMAGKKGES